MGGLPSSEEAWEGALLVVSIGPAGQVRRPAPLVASIGLDGQACRPRQARLLLLSRLAGRHILSQFA
jgi:hypothetical protein